MLNFNIGTNLKSTLFARKKSLTSQAIKEIESVGGRKTKEIPAKTIRDIVNKEVDESKKQQQDIKDKILKNEKIAGTGSLKKKEAKKIIEEAGTEGRKV